MFDILLHNFSQILNFNFFIFKILFSIAYYFGSSEALVFQPLRWSHFDLCIVMLEWSVLYCVQYTPRGNNVIIGYYNWYGLQTDIDWSSPTSCFRILRQLRESEYYSHSWYFVGVVSRDVYLLFETVKTVPQKLAVVRKKRVSHRSFRNLLWFVHVKINLPCMCS